MSVAQKPRPSLSREEFRRHCEQVQRTAPLASKYLQDKFASEDGTQTRTAAAQQPATEPRSPVSLILDAFRAKRMKPKLRR